LFQISKHSTNQDTFRKKMTFLSCRLY